MDSSLHFLRRASNEDLYPLVKHLIKPITEELSIKERYKRHYPNHREYVDEIVFELRLFASNTIANRFRRGEGLPYKKIVQNVASKLKIAYAADDPVEKVELKILLEILNCRFNKMSAPVIEAFEKAGASKLYFSSSFPIAAITVQIIIKSSRRIAYQAAMIVAETGARIVLGKGLRLTVLSQGMKLVGVNVAQKAFMGKMIGVFAGPIGWIITALWTAIGFSGPAYRVAIPCVCHIAYLRQKTKNHDDFEGDEQ